MKKTITGVPRMGRKEIYPDYSLKGLMLKLKLQYFGLLMRSVNSVILVKIEGRRKRG